MQQAGFPWTLTQIRTFLPLLRRGPASTVASLFKHVFLGRCVIREKLNHMTDEILAELDQEEASKVNALYRPRRD